jgi:hypothetical protein
MLVGATAARLTGVAALLLLVGALGAGVQTESRGILRVGYLHIQPITPEPYLSGVPFSRDYGPSVTRKAGT